MTLTVETGAIVLDADSYTSLAVADAYHLARANTEWEDADDEDKEAALIRATQALDIRYRGKWYGYKTNNNTDVVDPQLLSWPRKLETDSTNPIVDSEGVEIGINSIPQPVITAVCEIALIELTTRFIQKAVSKDDMIKRKKVDVLDTEWFEGAPPVTVYPFIDDILDGLTSGGSNTMEMTLGVSDDEQEIIDNADVDISTALTNTRYFL